MTNIVIKYMGLVSSLLCSLLGGFHLLKVSVTKSQESFSTSTLCCSQGCNAMQCMVRGSGEWVTCRRSSRFGAGLKPWSLAK